MPATAFVSWIFGREVNVGQFDDDLKPGLAVVSAEVDEHYFVAVAWWLEFTYWLGLYGVIPAVCALPVPAKFLKSFFFLIWQACWPVILGDVTVFYFCVWDTDLLEFFLQWG